MGIGQKIHDSINEWANEWGDRLRAWSGNVVKDATEKTFDFFEPDVRAELSPMIDRVLEIPNLPDDIKNIFTKAKEEPQAIQLAFLIPMAVGLLLGAGMGMATPLMKLGQYKIDNLIHSNRLEPNVLISAYWRGFITKEYVDKTLRELGYSIEDIATMHSTFKFYPSPQDLITWQAREVFEPTMIERYGLDNEFGNIQKAPFYKAGMTDEQILNYWRAHWEHASWNQVIEMLHRGQLTEEQVQDWFRLVEIPPFWRQRLTNVSWNIPTRVDVRRFWDMRTIDEARLREVYQWQGYHGKDLDDYVLWTKVYVAFPDLMARFKNGWLSEDDVRQQLISLGMPEERVEEMIQTKIKPEAPERVTKERDLTKTDIYRGVKKGILSRNEGNDLLQDMGYSTNEATFILALNAPVEDTQPAVDERDLSKADILKAFKLQELTEQDALSALINIRYSPVNAQLLLDVLKKTLVPIEDVQDRQVAKTDVIKAVKKAIITSEEGYLMLQDIGFTPEASDFILTVNAEVEEGSPDTYSEFKRMTQNYKASQGFPSKDVPQELVDAERELKASEASLKLAERQRLSTAKLAPYKQKVNDNILRYRQLLVQYKGTEEESLQAK